MNELVTANIKDYFESKELTIAYDKKHPGCILIGEKQEDGTTKYLNIHENHLVQIIQASRATRFKAQTLHIKIEMPTRAVTHRITIINKIGPQSETKSFSVICPTLTVEALNNVLKKLFDEKITKELKPEIVFMNEDINKTTHTVIVSSAKTKEKTYSFQIKCPSSSSNDIAHTIQKYLTTGAHI